MTKFYRKIKKAFKKLNKFITLEEFNNFKKWIFALIKTNYNIKKNQHKIAQEKLRYGTSSTKDFERQKRNRGEVYHIDFGVNIGSEYRYNHFGVVIKSTGKLAIVIPLTSSNSTYNQTNPLVVDLGIINGMPSPARTSYALVNQIRTLSKSRLMRIRDNNNYIRPKLTVSQLDLIDNCIKNQLTNL